MNNGKIGCLTREYRKMLFDLDREMIKYREAIKDKNSKEYQDHLRSEEIFSRPFKILESRDEHCGS